MSCDRMELRYSQGIPVICGPDNFKYKIVEPVAVFLYSDDFEVSGEFDFAVDTHQRIEEAVGFARPKVPGGYHMQDTVGIEKLDTMRGNIKQWLSIGDQKRKDRVTVFEKINLAILTTTKKRP